MSNFSPGTLVKVTTGAFVGQTGVILDTSKAVDVRGNAFPSTRPGYHWVMVTLSGALFPAHLHEDEIKPVGTKLRIDTDPQDTQSEP